MMHQALPEQGSLGATAAPDSAARIDHTALTPGAGFVAMDLDGGTVLLPQQDIESIEPGLELIAADEKTPAAGYIAYAGARWPVVCLGSDLAPLAAIPAGRRICLLLKTQERGYGVLCDGIQMLEADRLQIRDLPASMAMPYSPLEGLGIHEDKVVAVTSASALGAFLEHWAAKGADRSGRPPSQRTAIP